jgi:hypothetical protein
LISYFSFTANDPEWTNISRIFGCLSKGKP